MLRFFACFAVAFCIGACAVVSLADEKPTAQPAAEDPPKDPVVEKLKSNPDEIKPLVDYLNKQFEQVRDDVQIDPELALKRMKAIGELAASLKPTTDQGKQLKAEIEREVRRGTQQVAQMAEIAKKHKALVGVEAMPLKVDAWVNGEPLADKDLKGKVVLLDFWAVWCQPCIMSFPHLREWNEKYSEKGLVIVGLTNYYQLKWDEKAGGPTESEPAPSAAQEQEMLKKFAEKHQLKHRIAVVTDQAGEELSTYYGKAGIPHVVIVGRDNKVQLVKMGAGEEIAKEIEAAIKKALKEGV